MRWRSAEVVIHLQMTETIDIDFLELMIVIIIPDDYCSGWRIVVVTDSSHN